MLKDQIAVSQNFNSVSSIVSFNKRNNPQIDGFQRKKNFETPAVVEGRGDIFAHSNETKNVLKPTLYINNSTRKTTGADLANARPSFRKSNPVRYFSDFTIISAIENAHKSGKFHLDVGSIDRLKDYLRDNDKEPDKNIDNIPDIIPVPKIIEYTPSDAPMPSVKKPIEIPDSDPVIPQPSKWKSRLWTAAKWAAVLAGLGITYKLAKGQRGRRAVSAADRLRIQDMIEDDSKFGIDGNGDELEEFESILQEPSAPYADDYFEELFRRPPVPHPPSDADLRMLFPEPSAPPADNADLRYLFPEPSAPPMESISELPRVEDDYFETGDYKNDAELERKHDTDDIAALTEIMGYPVDDEEEFKEIVRVSEIEEKKSAQTNFDYIINDDSLSPEEKSERLREAVTSTVRPQYASEEKKYIDINSDGNNWNNPLYVRNKKLQAIIESDIKQNAELDEETKTMLLSEFVRGRPKREKLLSYVGSTGRSILRSIFNRPLPPSPPPPPKRRGLARKGRAT